LCRLTPYRGACSRTRCRFSLVALQRSYWNSQSRGCAPVCGSTLPSVPTQFVDCGGQDLPPWLRIYGARGKAEDMIARIRRMHDRVAGLTPAGEAYRANDLELLNWVQGTAAYGFLKAYHAYVRPLSDLQRDHYYAEGSLAASLYGATAPPSEAAFKMQLEAMSNRLERSDILFEFLAIMRSAPILPSPLKPVQPLLIRAAVDLIPHWLRAIVGLSEHSLNAWEAGVVRQIGAFADRLVLETIQRSKPAGACGFRPIICMSTRTWKYPLIWPPRRAKKSTRPRDTGPFRGHSGGDCAPTGRQNARHKHDLHRVSGRPSRSNLTIAPRGRRR
jgi:ER-bound oxygenase mpaB/B'/Rubber oxygenase, catalytic domain